MRTLTDLQRRIPASAQADEALQAEISRTQVAVQNLLSTDISSEPEFPASLPKGLARGLNLRPGNVMELLE